MPKRVVRNERTANQGDLDVGVRIREGRKQKKMSQTDLADRLGVTFQQVQKYELGRNRVSTGRLLDLAKALGVSTTFLLTGAEEKRGSRPPDEIASLLKTEGALRLMKAYDRMKSRGARQAFAELAEALVPKG